MNANVQFCYVSKSGTIEGRIFASGNCFTRGSDSVIYNSTLQFEAMASPAILLDRKSKILLEQESLRKFQEKHRKIKFARVKPTEEPIDYETTDEMSDAMIPFFLQHVYLTGDPKIESLREWQNRLLCDSQWQEGKNCVVVAPTSGGKTLIAEVAIAQLLDEQPYMKAIYALPFVALAAEKVTDFEARFSRFNVRPFFQNVGGSDFSKGSIAVCTYEKAHSIINSAIKGRYDDKIKLVVIDEVHMIGDETRGIVLESLIMKLKALRQPPRIVTLTATLNEEDSNKLARCVDGFCFFSGTGSLRMKHYISTPNGEVWKISGEKIEKLNFVQQSIKEDRDFLIPLTRSAVQGRSVIVFVTTRRDTKRIAGFLATHYHDGIPGVPNARDASEEIRAKRKELIHELAKCPAGMDNELAKCIAKGIAFHNAGLLLEERKVVEMGIREKAISIVVATTTLSAGINIPSVSRVIIHSPYRRFNNTQTLLPAAQFAQMAGRAGRTSNGCGDVFVIAQNDRERMEIYNLLTNPLPNIRVTLTNTGQLYSYMLQALSLGLASDIFTLRNFMKSSFELNLDIHQSEIEIVDSAVKYLTENGLIKDFKTTKLGNAITAANLSISEGLALNDVVDKVLNAVCLTDDVHLLFVCAPEDSTIYIPPFSDPIWEDLFDKHSFVIGLITGKTVEDLRRIVMCSYAGQTKVSNDEYLTFTKIYSACLLCNLIDECSLNEVERTFKIDRGTIQTLQSAAASHAAQSVRFTEAMGHFALSAALQSFLKRLTFAVKPELVDLMSMPSMRRDIARVLYDQGFKTVADVASLSSRELAAMMPHQAQGMTESDYRAAAKKIIDEADALSEQIALLEEMAEESTWMKVMQSRT